MAKYDYLIVGSGLFGATFAHIAHKRGKKCLVIEKRYHLGGNIYCEEIKGINVHKYGAHIFHTSDKLIWDFVNSIVPFNRYTNSPVAMAPNGKLYNLPFNMNTFYQMWGVRTPKEAQIKLNEQRQEVLERMRENNIVEPRNLEEQALMLIGKDIYEQLIKDYTEKQWGRPCNQLPAFIIRRLPVRMTYDNNYFNDIYQGIPIGGYNKLTEGLLDGIEVKLNTDFFENRDKWESVADKIIFTGKIDEFYNYCFGKLEYRTVRFQTEVLDEPNFQGNAVVNYTTKQVPFTRIIEHKHFESFGNSVYDNPHTVISREYSTEWMDGMEPFYPVNDTKNQVIYEKYQKLAKEDQNIIFGGRLAEYKYYDMAPIISNVFNLIESLCQNNHKK
ncbi:UDP-galactopyranose mutase [uncultured Duncaniella sp.]|uniref:UDP-galactopyranose mutase n=1 Tax=uncultured Duncaniella sp. TaxID=2768039 RepID=UPI0026762990|nr:UDP-galactopyranose mutase [uncultured Duncaniella sp.]